jgi:hypothetical protein
VKVTKNGTRAQATLKSKGTGVAAIFAGKGSRQVEPKGIYALGVFPAMTFVPPGWSAASPPACS